MDMEKEDDLGGREYEYGQVGQYALRDREWPLGLAYDKNVRIGATISEGL